MAYTVIWYGRQGIVDKMTFDAEKVAKDYAISMFQTRKGDDGIVSVEVRKDNGAVVFATRRIRKARGDSCDAHKPFGGLFAEGLARCLGGWAVGAAAGFVARQRRDHEPALMRKTLTEPGQFYRSAGRLGKSQEWPAAGKAAGLASRLAGNGSGAQGRPASIFNEGGERLFPRLPQIY